MKPRNPATRIMLRSFCATVGESRYIGIKLTIPEKLNTKLTMMLKLIGAVTIVVGIFWLGDHYGFTGIEEIIKGIFR